MPATPQTSKDIADGAGPDSPSRADPASGVLLLVDDNAESLESLKIAFSRSAYHLRAAVDGRQALHMLASEPVDVVVTDLKMPNVDGMTLLRRALAMEHPPQVILLTAFGTVESAVEALQQGAFHYLTKPVNLKELRAQVQKAMTHQSLRRENKRLRAELDERFGFEGLVGESPPILEIMNKVRLVAGSRATVLILGQSGTGKELIARAIHQNGTRKNRPFVPVHCAAISETLMESELFGHERGAFTGAIARKMGRFEQADGGSLFLDEVGEIPMSMQVKLLRVIESLEFQRVGGTQPIQVDVRLIAATNRDLSTEVAEGRFREDLFYRLNVIALQLPLLSQRQSDIPLLTHAFVEEFARAANRSVPRIEQDFWPHLMSYSWPGNIRELRNVMENIMVFLEGESIGPELLPPHIATGPKPGKLPQGLGLGQTLHDAEIYLIRQTLEAHGGNRTRAAEALGISRRTLQRKIKELELGR